MTFDYADLATLAKSTVHALPAVLLIIVVALFLNLIVGRAMRVVAGRTSLTDTEVQPARALLRWLVNLAAFGFILEVLGVNVSGLWGVLSTILAMVAIGFVAVWSVLSNTLCTVIILVARPFSVGDEVEIPGDNVKGRVTDLNFIYTTLEAEDGALVQVPNNIFFQKVIRRRVGSTSVSLAEQLKAKSADTGAKGGTLPVGQGAA